MNTQVPRAVATQLFVCTLFMLAPFSYATSVAFVRDGDRILIAVDSRELQATVERETKASDASCKVAILGGKYVFVGALAIAHEDNDLYPQWRSTSEARAAYQGGSHL